MSVHTVNCQCVPFATGVALCPLSSRLCCRAVLLPYGTMPHILLKVQASLCQHNHSTELHLSCLFSHIILHNIFLKNINVSLLPASLFSVVLPSRYEHIYIYIYIQTHTYLLKVEQRLCRLVGEHLSAVKGIYKCARDAKLYAHLVCVWRGGVVS